MAPIRFANLKRPHLKNKVLALLLAYSSILFSLGMVFDLVMYIINNNKSLAIINIVSLTGFLVIFTLYHFEKITVQSAIFMQLSTMSLNICGSMIYEMIQGNPHSGEIMLFNMCVYIVVVLLSVFTLYKFAPLLVASTGLATYVSACIIMGDMELLTRIPTLLLVFIGVPMALVNIIHTIITIERENIKIQNEQQELLRMLDLDPELLKLVKTTSVNKRRASELFEKMDEHVRDSIIARIRNVVISEERTIAALKARCPQLTASELEICRLIVEGKSLCEICEMRHVSVSTITSTRSRLRTKLGLEKGESLQSHLKSVVNASLMNQLI